MDLEYSVTFWFSLPNMYTNLIFCSVCTSEQSILSTSFVYNISYFWNFLDVMEHCINATSREMNIIIEPCWLAKTPMHRHISIWILKCDKIVVNYWWSSSGKDLVEVVELVIVGFWNFQFVTRQQYYRFGQVGNYSIKFLRRYFTRAHFLQRWSLFWSQWWEELERMTRVVVRCKVRNQKFVFQNWFQCKSFLFLVSERSLFATTKMMPFCWSK